MLDVCTKIHALLAKHWKQMREKTKSSHNYFRTSDLDHVLDAAVGMFLNDGLNPDKWFYLIRKTFNSCRFYFNMVTTISFPHRITLNTWIPQKHRKFAVFEVTGVFWEVIIQIIKNWHKTKLAKTTGIRKKKRLSLISSKHLQLSNILECMWVFFPVAFFFFWRG